MLRIANAYFECGEAPIVDHMADHDRFVESLARYSVWCQCNARAGQYIKELNDDVEANE